MLVSFVASSRSELGAFGRMPDWLSHGAEYLILGLLLCRALAGGFEAPLSLAGAALAVVLGTAWGASDEWHQSLVPGREATLGDVLKDLGGCAAGAAVHLGLLGGARR
jgi:VanZ family protein